MKKGILFLLLVAGFVAQAQQKQSLKDLLYSGKLKSDSGSVVRSSENLTAKIDTSTRKPVEAEKPKSVATVAAEPQKQQTAVTNTNPATEAIDSSASTAPLAKATPPKSTTRIWKEYTDSLSKVLKTEVLSNKKIKKDTYFFTVEYEIETDGQVNVLNVTSAPENALLQSEIKTRMETGTPQLAPVLNSAGQPQKVKRRYGFNITKE